ncbi:MAG: cation:proton antiporter [Chloroflexota bacterium]|nr:MAG: cation:proton antiporter [Chloroflexota bacterium]
MVMGPIAIFVILIFFFTLISKRIEKTILTAPIIFTLAGMFVYLISPRLAELELHNHTILLIAELTLALLLFTDATRIDFRKLLKETILPGRLLGIGMPLTILAGTIAAMLVFHDFPIWEAALLAVILAPTDASLGQVVVKSQLVPERIRQALNVEAGLNDGLAMPLFTLFVGLAAETDPLLSGNWLLYSVEQIFFGIFTGIILGRLGGWLIGEAGNRGWIDESVQQLGLLALALMCYGGAVLIGGNGFIAAFTGGLLVKRGFEDAHFHTSEFSEAWGQLLNYFVFFIFGMIAAQVLPQFDVTTLIFALLSLTFVRMIPVAVAMIRTRLNPATVLFMGWFGPRGLASIVLGLVFLEREVELSYGTIIIQAVAATVLISIFAHGVSALPGIKWYTRRIEDLDESALELQEPVSLVPGMEPKS